MLKFKDGKFRIMQVADIQEQPSVHPDSILLLKLAIEREKPDLVVFSGDQIYGLSPLYRKNTRNKVEKTISDILEPIEKADIPFTITFGNHDRQCGLSNIEQAGIYGKHKGFIDAAANGDERDGVAFIPVFNGDYYCFNIVLIDSNGQAATGEYEPVSEIQLESYIRQRDANNNPCIIIQHIPFEEYFSVIERVKIGTKGAVEGFRNHAHEWFRLPENLIASGGFMLESPATPDRNSGEFDVIKEGGNCLAVAVGHDHNNSFVAEKDGIKLIYTQGCGFNVYGPKKKRGVRIFDISCTPEVSLSTHTVTYEELTDKPVTRPVQEFVLTHIPTSMEQVKRLAAVAIAGLAVSLPLSVLAIKKHKRR